MAVNIYIGNQRQVGNANTTSGKWLQEIAESVVSRTALSMDRKINIPKLEQTLNAQLRNILVQAQKVVTSSIIGRMTTASSGSGETSFSLNALRNYIGISPETLAYRNQMAGRAVFSNQSAWNRPWSNNADRAVSVQWKNLTKSTLRRKGPGNPNRLKFFLHSGSLRGVLSSGGLVPGKIVEVRGISLDKNVQRFRDARGRFTKFVPDVIQVKQIRITILPGMPRAIVTGLMKGDWDNNLAFERWLGLDEKTLKKLGGQSKSHPVRHLLQPVYSYYLRREVPTAISNAIQRAVL